MFTFTENGIVHVIPTTEDERIIMAALDVDAPPIDVDDALARVIRDDLANAHLL